MEKERAFFILRLLHAMKTCAGKTIWDSISDMKTYRLFAGLSVMLMAVSSVASVSAEEISLPKPVTTGGMPLMEALQKRASGRKFSDRQLTPQEMSNLLWAAWGVNREDGRRTAPSARNIQEITLYVSTRDGVFEYDAPYFLQTIHPLTHPSRTFSDQFFFRSFPMLVFAYNPAGIHR